MALPRTLTAAWCVHLALSFGPHVHYTLRHTPPPLRPRSSSYLLPLRSAADPATVEAPNSTLSSPGTGAASMKLTAAAATSAEPLFGSDFELSGVVVNQAEAEEEQRMTIHDVVMEQLKEQPRDNFVGQVLRSINPKLLRIWTKADFLHAHAVSGVVFLALGTVWQLARVADAFQHGDAGGWLASDSALAGMLMFSGLLNGLTAIPMARFSSNKILDLSDLKGNGFSLGGTGLTAMCLWLAWWFSGSLPDALHGADTTLFLFFSALCVGTTYNWELMVQKNFSGGDNEFGGQETKPKTTRSDRKFVAAATDTPGSAAATMDASTTATKKWLYRIASWPNLTQILFMTSVVFGGTAWLEATREIYPEQPRLLFDYSFASALGYSLSMFGETLRDRKLITLEQDFVILLFGVVAPMGIVVLDWLASDGAAQINPAQYWFIFTHLGAL